MDFIIRFVSYRWSDFGPMDGVILFTNCFFVLEQILPAYCPGGLGNIKWQTMLIEMTVKYYWQTSTDNFWAKASSWTIISVVGPTVLCNTSVKHPRINQFLTFLWKNTPIICSNVSLNDNTNPLSILLYLKT